MEIYVENEIAAKTGGAYFRAKNTKGLEEIYKKLDELEPTIQEAETLRPEKALFYWPLSIAVLFALLYSVFSSQSSRISTNRAGL